MIYLDTSAFFKLVVGEPESRALQGALDGSDEPVSSALIVVESRRGAMRYGGTAGARVRSALGGITLVPVDDATLELAAELEPPRLRSLDAIHLATALSLGEELERFYCYDARLADAAAVLGLRVAGPG